MSCIVSDNQPIYQALLDKAASYPADKVAQYKADAYKSAAEAVLHLTNNLYDRIFIRPSPGIGFKTEQFIWEFIDNNPRVPNTRVQQHNE